MVQAKQNPEDKIDRLRRNLNHSKTQKQGLTSALARYDLSGDGEIDALIVLLKMGMKEYLPGFLKSLEASEVGILLKDLRDPQSMLVLADTENNPLLAIFTKKEHANTVKESHAEYRYLAQTRMKNLCQSFSGSIGLVINPGHNTFEYIRRK